MITRVLSAYVLFIFTRIFNYFGRHIIMLSAAYKNGFASFRSGTRRHKKHYCLQHTTAVLLALHFIFCIIRLIYCGPNGILHYNLVQGTLFGVIRG